MLHIGCHLSVSKGFTALVREALSLNADTFQFFSRNPRGGAAKDMDPADVAAANDLMAQHAFAPVLMHAPYTLNPASQDPKIRSFAQTVMADDLTRLARINNAMYNFHPGSHVGQGVGAGISNICALLNHILTPDIADRVLLETMSGKGSEIGATFGELAEIMAQTTFGDRLGVCLDTCHVYAAGYDIVSCLDKVLADFDKTIGLKHLKAVHLNDSMTPLASHKDRHAKIGAGTIGLAALERLINHPALKGVPFYLETPNDLTGYKNEINMLRSAFKG